ncbi:MAG: radical SAM protein [Candidatus Lokiarchaeota archaeon]|jgi:radical SAM protein (TIGR04043 family)
MSLLRKKVELLCKGVYLDNNLNNNFEVRTGGAGPFGGGYFFLENNSNIVNIPFWQENGKNPKNSNFLLTKRNNHFEVLDLQKNEHFCNLKAIRKPRFYNLKTSDGLKMKQIALLHGEDCLATTIYQKCRYWRCGEMCKFCGIELSLYSGNTILEKNYDQISEVVNAAKREGRCNHITLTSGFTSEDDKGLNRYMNILEGLKKDFPEISVHIQIEPVKNLDFINELKDAGADTIGIHIEILDDFLRNMITPGKAKIPYKLYEENWKYSVDIFGKNQVETFLLCGFGEDADDFINSIEHVISLGVIPYIVPVRSIPDKIFKFPGMNVDFFLQVYKKAANMMHHYGVNPLDNLAGCVRCGCCSALIEAYSEIA